MVEVRDIILCITAAVAVYGIYRNTTINRRRATVGLVIHQRSDEKLIKASDTLKQIIDEGNVTKYSGSEHKASPERKAILTVLNNYEFIATGMRHGAFDFGLYKDMRYNIIIRDWDAVEPFILDMRKKLKTSSVFQEFEWMARKTKRKGLKSKSN